MSAGKHFTKRMALSSEGRRYSVLRRPDGKFDLIFYSETKGQNYQIATFNLAYEVDMVARKLNHLEDALKESAVWADPIGGPE